MVLLPISKSDAKEQSIFLFWMDVGLYLSSGCRIILKQYILEEKKHKYGENSELIMVSMISNTPTCVANLLGFNYITLHNNQYYYGLTKDPEHPWNTGLVINHLIWVY